MQSSLEVVASALEAVAAVVRAGTGGAAAAGSGSGPAQQRDAGAAEPHAGWRRWQWLATSLLVESGIRRVERWADRMHQIIQRANAAAADGRDAPENPEARTTTTDDDDDGRRRTTCNIHITI